VQATPLISAHRGAAENPERAFTFPAFLKTPRLDWSDDGSHRPRMRLVKSSPGGEDTGEGGRLNHPEILIPFAPPFPLCQNHSVQATPLISAHCGVADNPPNRFGNSLFIRNPRRAQ